MNNVSILRLACTRYAYKIYIITLSYKMITTRCCYCVSDDPLSSTLWHYRLVCTHTFYYHLRFGAVLVAFNGVRLTDFQYIIQQDCALRGVTATTTFNYKKYNDPSRDEWVKKQKNKTLASTQCIYYYYRYNIKPCKNYIFTYNYRVYIASWLLLLYVILFVRH